MSKPINTYERYLTQLDSIYERLIDRDIMHKIELEEEEKKRTVKMILVQHNNNSKQEDDKHDT